MLNFFSLMYKNFCFFLASMFVCFMIFFIRTFKLSIMLDVLICVLNFSLGCTYLASNILIYRLNISSLNFQKLLLRRTQIVQTTEAVAQRCSENKMFLKILQNSQESTRARVSFLIKLPASGLDNRHLRLKEGCC